MEDKKEEIKKEEKSLAMELLEELKRQNKRLIVALFVVIALWASTIGGFIWYLNQYDFSSYEVNSQDGGNANFIGNDGDINNYGESSSNKTDEEER